MTREMRCEQTGCSGLAWATVVEMTHEMMDEHDRRDGMPADARERKLVTIQPLPRLIVCRFHYDYEMNRRDKLRKLREEQAEAAAQADEADRLIAENMAVDPYGLAEPIE